DVAEHYRAALILKPVKLLSDAAALEKVLTEAPKDYSSALILAKLYMHNDKLSDARRVLDEAIRNNQGRDELAELRLVVTERAAKQIAAEQARAYYQLAENTLKRDQPSEALDHLQAAGKADAEILKSVEAQRFQGRVREKMKQPFNALVAYQEVLRQAPTDGDALAACIRLRLATGNREEALNALLRYTLAAGTDAEKLTSAAEFHLQMDRLDDAAALATRAIPRAANAQADKAAERVLGLVHYRKEQFADAVAHLEKADLDDILRDKLVRAYLILGLLRKAEDAVSSGKGAARD